MVLTIQQGVSSGITSFSGIGNWTDTTSWTGSFPTSSVSVTLGSTSSLELNTIESCLDFDLGFLADLKIKSTGQLSVFGDFYNYGGNLVIANGGKIIFMGDLYNSLGYRHIEIEGSLELEGAIELDETVSNSQPR